ncbi:hypothetical protein T01_5659 [Trichinella spiralis]|uniref:Uncharacterized protein n=1 Tax=Trichinella spiralis TaxID=6334 RepID=A0A0V1BS09_TRISP|nr:hypothetical protein T01_5659 [Trichinella spiralis]
MHVVMLCQSKNTYTMSYCMKVYYRILSCYERLQHIYGTMQANMLWKCFNWRLELALSMLSLYKNKLLRGVDSSWHYNLFYLTVYCILEIIITESTGGPNQTIKKWFSFIKSDANMYVNECAKNSPNDGHKIKYLRILELNYAIMNRKQIFNVSHNSVCLKKGAEQQQVSVAGDALMISLRCSCCNALAIDSQMTVVMKKTGRLILNATKRYRTDGDKRTNQYTCLYMCWEEAGLQVTTSIEQQQQTKDWPLPTAGQQFLTAPPSTRTATAISYKTLANRLFTTADCTAATEQQQQQQQQQASKQAKQSSKQQEKIAIADQRWTTASKQH